MQFGDTVFIALGAIVELHSFVSSDAQRHSLFVNQAYLTAEKGSVNNNTIASVLSPIRAMNHPTTCTTAFMSMCRLLIKVQE
jgi:hypothetical protein